MKTLRRVAVAALALVVVTAALLEAQTTGPADREIQRFVLPGSNTTGMRVHSSRTVMSQTLAGNIIATGGYKAAFTYAHPEFVVTTVTNAHLPIAGTPRAGSSGVAPLMPSTGGSIIGVSIASSAALTRDAAHVEAVMLRGGLGVVASGLRAVIGGGLTNTQFAASTQARGLTNFTATDAVTCRLTTDANVRPLTAQIACTVIVEF